MVNGIVYMFHFPNNKGYIGQTVTPLEARLWQHWFKAKAGRQAVCSAIRKYGKENIEVEKVVEMKCTQEYLNLIEQRAIKHYNTLAPNGYNLTEGGSKGARSQETKEKISMSSRGRKKPPRTKEHSMKIGLANKGRKQPPRTKEHRMKLGLANKGRVVSPETRLKMRMAKLGKPLSKEHIAKLRLNIQPKDPTTGRWTTRE